MGGGGGAVGPGWSGNKLQLNTIQYNTLHTIRKLLFARTARKHKFADHITSAALICPSVHMMTGAGSQLPTAPHPQTNSDPNIHHTSK